MLNQGSLNGMMTATAADGMLRPHNAAAMRRHEFVVTTQRCRTRKSALCGDHMTLPQARTALCGDRMTLPQALTALCGDRMTLPQLLAALCGDHMTLPQARTALCGDHMTLPSFLGRYAQNYKKIETKNFQKKEFLQFSNRRQTESHQACLNGRGAKEEGR